MTLSACGSKTSSNIPDTLVDENTETNDKSTETENKNNLMINSIDATASETGPDTGKFIISRNGENTDKDLEVFYTFSGTAVLGSDYRAIPESTTKPRVVTIPKGCKTVEITITPIDDTISEEAETVIANLVSNGAYNIIKKGSATVTINDNDYAFKEKPIVKHYWDNYESFDNALVVFSRTGSTNADLTVYYSVSGTAVKGVDYISSLSGSIVIPAGSKTAHVSFGWTHIDRSEPRYVLITLTPNSEYDISTNPVIRGTVQ